MRLSDGLGVPFAAGLTTGPCRRSKWYKKATLAAAGTFSGAVVAGTAVLAEPPVAQATTTGQAQATTSAAIDVAAVAAATDPAVVDVDTALDALEGGGTGAGTGMVVSPGGLVVTNNHVVQGADTVTVVVPGHGGHPASVIGTDPSADIAVLKVSGLSGLPTVKFGDSSSATVGLPVVAIGNALGLGGAPTVTQGIISAPGRTITATDETGSNPETLHGLLQTDAPIAPGNSGGPWWTPPPGSSVWTRRPPRPGRRGPASDSPSRPTRC